MSKRTADRLGDPLCRPTGGLLRPWVLSACLGLALLPPPAWAASPATGETAEPWSFKFTPSVYVESAQPKATDLNLRANRGDQTLWVGHYNRGSDFEQTRLGYEYTYKASFGQVVPSLQVASRGFAGASVTAQIGSESVWAIVGFGRTNLKPYYNLNFDPNDSVVLGLGVRPRQQTVLSAFMVVDDRLDTDQKVVHAVWREWFDGRRRLTLDLAWRQGRAVPGEPEIRGDAISVGFDYQDVFVRIVRDRKVNFTQSDQSRLALGVRF